MELRTFYDLLSPTTNIWLRWSQYRPTILFSKALGRHIILTTTANHLLPLELIPVENIAL